MSVKRRLGIVASLFLVACGQGNDPMVSLGDATQLPLATMSLPLSSGLQSFTPFGAGQNGFVLNGTSVFLSTTAVKAPAAGTVIAVDLGSGMVNILHTPRVVSQISGISSLVQVGNYVTQDSQIGVTSTVVNQVRFSIFVDGVAVCPLSFLSTTARSQLINTWNYSQNPCQP